ncbi:putative signal transduction histidine kinase [Beutenbergia cavernae DSM 12333]|uniref:Putative signal transduction histidine kinase n=1 Tax=Beutenbergia cavernae (strain ATCC BAA-8 / DSM 12333 / CCUG 43141 / JCM 11478 / NBRC 16432 / NCIMB 13614 / HKI 0122) TaxID=471853 RepID=C5BZU8_BEUC1|nr:ATP-binding protein [Beutenbergia cavernae]ACQ81278.1 putative signal transduction histidine kinase [Beutenbergia cavernae DSM 12333]
MTEARLPLRRPDEGRWIGGVARGLSVHLRIRVDLVRWAFVALGLLGGAGLVLYVFWWVTIPPGNPADALARERPSTWTRLVRPPQDPDAAAVPPRRIRVADIGIALGLLAVAVVVLAQRSGMSTETRWYVPVLLLLAGTALAWSQLDARRSGADSPRVSRLRLVGGLVIAAAGVLLLVGQEADPALLLQSAVAALAVLAGVALVLAPWWLRLVRELGDERAARARESERADIAAHLHDSVLQTLALIRARATDADVARLARAQERELRTWLYDDRSAPGTSLAAEVADVVAHVEDTRSAPDGSAVAVETVVVGDCIPDETTHALLLATREALVNAVAHGRPPVSLYVEVGAQDVEVFVRDRGDGFDLDAVPSDRFGVRESIIGRVRRRGGDASVRSSDAGTEVRLRVPAPARDGSAGPAATTATAAGRQEEET